MDIADLNLIGDFEAGIKCLQNPSLISNTIPQLYSFWTFGALVIAVFATFTNVFKKIKLFIHRIHIRFLAACQKSCPQQIFNDDDFDFSEDGDDDTPSSVVDSDDEEFESEDDRVVFRAEGSSYWGSNGQDGNFTLRQRRNCFSWSDFSAGKSVVQLWDSFGLGLDFEDDEFEHVGENSISDLDQNTAAEKVVVTADMDDIYAAWSPRQRLIWSDDDGGVGQKEE